MLIQRSFENLLINLVLTVATVICILKDVKTMGMEYSMQMSLILMTLQNFSLLRRIIIVASFLFYQLDLLMKFNMKVFAWCIIVHAYYIFLRK